MEEFDKINIRVEWKLTRDEKLLITLLVTIFVSTFKIKSL